MTAIPPQSRRIAIIDQETRAELAEIGMDAVQRRVLCRDCRFRRNEYNGDESSVSFDICIVRGRQPCNDGNPEGECDRFEDLPPRAPQLPARVESNALAFIGIGAAFVVGACAGILVTAAGWVVVAW